MAIPVLPIGPETFQQPNAFATNADMLQNLYTSQIQNRYLPATFSAQLMHQQLLNKQLQSQVQLSPEMAAAQLAQAQAQVPYTQAQTQGILQGQIPQQQAQAGFLGANTNLLNQSMPYRVQQAQGSVYSDPILQRLFQINLANKTGAIPSPYLSGAGLPNQQYQPSTPMPNMNGFINNGMQGGGQVPPNQLLPQNPYASPMTAPNAFNGNGFQNWALFGSPYNPIEYKAAEKGATQEAQTQATQWNDTQNSAQNDAYLGNQLQNFAEQFQKSYSNSTYKGPFKGKVPTTGWETALVPGNLTPEQLTDNASQNAAAMVAKLIAGGRVTNYEMQYINNLKPNRMMTPQAAQMTSDFLIQRAKQMQQLPQFLNAAQQQGLDVHTAQSLWNMYRQQRPVYDFGAQKPNTQFDGSWRDYLNPNAIQAAQSGRPYINTPNLNKNDLKSWYKTLNPQDRKTFNATIQGGQ